MGSALRTFEDEFFAKSHEQIPLACQAAMDQLLTAEDGDQADKAATPLHLPSCVAILAAQALTAC